MEIEQNNQLPFLDVLIHRYERSFKFDVYRKPTNVLSYVHFYSSHHSRTKASVLSSMYLRAYRICSPEFLDDEFLRICNIASKLKYPKYLIENSQKMARKSYFEDKTKDTFNSKNLLVLPYHDNFIKLPHILKNFNIQVIFSNSNTVRSLLIKNSPENKEGCVYKIPCKNCNKCYIGQTGKELNVRLKQHKYSVRSGQMSNALFVHLRDFNHCINWEEAKVIVKSNSYLNRNIIESSLIKDTFVNNLNLSHGLYKLDNFIIKKIVSQTLVNLSP